MRSTWICSAAWLLVTSSAALAINPYGHPADMPHADRALEAVLGTARIAQENLRAVEAAARELEVASQACVAASGNADVCAGVGRAERHYQGMLAIYQQEVGLLAEWVDRLGELNAGVLGRDCANEFLAFIPGNVRRCEILRERARQANEQAQRELENLRAAQVQTGQAAEAARTRAEGARTAAEARAEEEAEAARLAEEEAARLRAEADNRRQRREAQQAIAAAEREAEQRREEREAAERAEAERVLAQAEQAEAVRLAAQEERARAEAEAERRRRAEELAAAEAAARARVEAGATPGEAELRSDVETASAAGERLAENAAETERVTPVDAARTELARQQRERVEQIVAGADRAVECRRAGTAVFGLDAAGQRQTSSAYDCSGSGASVDGSNADFLPSNAPDIAAALGLGVTTVRGATLGEVALDVRRQLGDSSLPLWGPGGLVDLIASVNQNIADPNRIGTDQDIVIPSPECLREAAAAQSAQVLQECQARARVSGVDEPLGAATGLVQRQIAESDAAADRQDDLFAECRAAGKDLATCQGEVRTAMGGEFVGRLSEQQRADLLSDTLSRAETSSDDAPDEPLLTTAELGEEYSAIIELAQQKQRAGGLTNAQTNEVIRSMIREAASEVW